VRVRDAVLELADAVEEFADENGAGIVEVEVTPEPLRFGQSRSTHRLKQGRCARPRARIKQAEGDVAPSKRDPDSGLSGDHGQLDGGVDGRRD
jgi:hypothetical protein